MKITSCGVYRVRLPFRLTFRHSSAERRSTDNLVVRLVLEDGTEGFGEGVPREYVTGETAESSAHMIAKVHLLDLLKLDPVSFGEAVWAAAGLKVVRDGPAVFNAARCAVELALIDAYGKAFGAGLKELRDVLPGLGQEGGSSAAPLTAVIPFLGKRKSRAVYRFFRLFGYRSFKVKLGRPEDPGPWALAAFLGKRARRGDIALRVDANEAWTPREAPALMERLARLGVESVEQPVPKAELRGLARPQSGKGKVEVVADESARTAGEVERLAAERACDAVQVRLSKCGGLFPSLRLVEVARRYGLRCHLGAMVGETGILAAAQSLFLTIAPGLASVEPSLSRLLLRRNIVRRPSVLGGLTGLWPTRGSGLGVVIDRRCFHAFSDILFEETMERSRVPK